ncbi:MAG TPA: M23 family metallopeptidase [Symbiobacteriaceae bacterium]|nr:M23 family metallopeptidase [Symbiobacteriaceae bacterium]
MTSAESPQAAARVATFWEPVFDPAESGHGPAHVMSTRFLRPETNLAQLRLPALETYTVREGDTLTAIADAYDTDMATLQSLNEAVAADSLHPGQELKVVKSFHGLTYAVQDGDTLESVSRAYGIDADEIRYANGLQIDAGLKEGEVLFLPGARPARSRMVVSRGEARPETRAVATATVERPVAEIAPKPAPAPAPAAPTPAAPPPPAPQPVAAAKPAAGEGWIWPIDGGDRSSEYGWRSDIGDFHEGIDIAVPAGTPAKATKSGVVAMAGWDGGYGICVIIDHGDGTKSRYAHASALLVSVGQQVAQGQAVIAVGSTGHSTGNHLHFEIIVNGKPQNPRNYLP